MTSTAALVLVGSGFALGARPAGPRQLAPVNCDKRLEGLKTWADGQRFQVKAAPPQVTTLYIINGLAPPGKQPRTRASSWQRRVWFVRAQIVEYRLLHAELRMILYWENSYVTAVLPASVCLPKESRQRAQIIGAWNYFLAHCGVPTTRWQSLGAVAYVSGVGFWANRNRPKRGQPANGAELHPVTGLTLIAGCGT